MKKKQPEKCRYDEDCSRCYVGDDVCEWIDYTPSRFLWEYYRKIAIIRFFEIWGDCPRDKAKVLRGMGVNKNKEASISGMLSTLKEFGIINKTREGHWAYSGVPKKYATKNKIRLMGPEAIRICKTVAKSSPLNSQSKERQT